MAVNKESSPISPTMLRTDPTKVWKNLLKKNSDIASTKLKFKEPIVKDNGESGAKFLDEEFEETTDKWRHCLVGYFLGRKPYYVALREFLSRKWKIKGDFQLYAFHSGFFLFQFSNEEDCTSVLESPSLTYSGRILILQRWAPGSELERIKLSSILVWVKLPGLHLKFGSTNGLSKLGSIIGNPLYMDSQTAESTRLSYARFCRS
ncbi:uncharacterized protein LOC143861658 [Tasmannia lanceolata]|uniref:uncharacterized protein LOC143861658 n=1 Tax=Tasmannia lanceolata TaxID=3420 RepID=UPI00406461A8